MDNIGNIVSAFVFGFLPSELDNVDDFKFYFPNNDSGLLNRIYDFVIAFMCGRTLLAQVGQIEQQS